MKHYRILKAFNGSQTGNDFASFEAGSVALLSDDLARIALKEGWAELALPAETMKPSRVEDDVKPLPVEVREIKVVEPEETKPAKPFAKKKK